jgi:hypothetical protein
MKRRGEGPKNSDNQLRVNSRAFEGICWTMFDDVVARDNADYFRCKNGQI